MTSSMLGILLWVGVSFQGLDTEFEPAEGLDSRLEFLQEAFDEQEVYARVWWWGWFSGYGASAVASFGMAYDDTFPTRTTTLWTNGIKSSLAALNMIVFRPCVQCDGGSRFRKLSEGSLIEKRDKILVGERMLERMASEGSKHFRWARHLLGLGVNTTISTIQWRKLKQDPTVPPELVGRQILTSFLLGLVVTEANIFSEPWGAPRRLRDYREISSDENSSLEWGFAPIPNGLSLVGRF